MQADIELIEQIKHQHAVMLIEGREKDERIAELEARNAKLVDALERIASCEKRCDGDVVDVARNALKP